MRTKNVKAYAPTYFKTQLAIRLPSSLSEALVLKQTLKTVKISINKYLLFCQRKI